MRFNRGFFWFMILLFAVIQIAEATQLKIILRYDDFSKNSNIDVERALFDVTKSIGGGILVGVIPFRKSPHPVPESHTEHENPLLLYWDKRKIDLLRTYTSQGVVEIAVHGYNHNNNGMIEGVNSEFRGLPEKTQSLLLSTAKIALETAIGLKVNSFVPPFNQYDINTLTSLERNGYKLISAGLAGPTLNNSDLSYLPGGPYPQISAAIFAKACFGHPSPIKRQKLRGS